MARNFKYIYYEKYILYDLRCMVERSSCVSPFITAGESTGVSRGTNWLTPGTRRNFFNKKSFQNVIFRNRTHCDLAKIQVMCFLVFPKQAN